jgi:hypothetical protein
LAGPQDPMALHVHGDIEQPQRQSSGNSLSVLAPRTNVCRSSCACSSMVVSPML